MVRAPDDLLSTAFHSAKIRLLEFQKKRAQVYHRSSLRRAQEDGRGHTEPHRLGGLVRRHKERAPKAKRSANCREALGA
jgi:hypothetical protein